jgi:hypothetical protein
MAKWKLEMVEKNALPDINLDSATNLVCNTTTDEYLLSCGIMAANVDFTYKFKGVFNKPKVIIIERIITKHNFRMQNHKQGRMTSKHNPLGIGLNDNQERHDIREW